MRQETNCTRSTSSDAAQSKYSQFPVLLQAQWPDCCGLEKVLLCVSLLRNAHENISWDNLQKYCHIFFKEENYSSYTLFIKKIKKYIMYKNKIFCIENKKKKLKSCSWKNLIKSKIKMWRSWEIVWSHQNRNIFNCNAINCDVANEIALWNFSDQREEPNPNKSTWIS